jgi:hypothetical protein
MQRHCINPNNQVQREKIPTVNQPSKKMLKKFELVKIIIIISGSENFILKIKTSPK